MAQAKWRLSTYSSSADITSASRQLPVGRDIGTSHKTVEIGYDRFKSPPRASWGVEAVARRSMKQK
jgi:hypothetical protein